MTLPQILILLVLTATVVLFLWGRWRHDLVSLISLLACVALGLVPANQAFAGFANAAVITVAAVLVMSRALEVTGAVDGLTRLLLPAHAGKLVTITTLTALGTTLSAFMNNVGALALLMPVAIQMATRLKLSPGQILMPLSFGTLLGGMTTLIGTPPNLIVSGFREQDTGQGFAMFDFSVAGVPVAVAGLLFLVLIGWRMVPQRRQSGSASYEVGAYITEIEVLEQSPLILRHIREAEAELEGVGAQILGLIRNGVPVSAPRATRVLRVGDILIIEGDVGNLAGILPKLGLQLAGQSSTPAMADPEVHARRLKAIAPDDFELAELVVMPGSELSGRSVSDIHLRSRYGVNLLAISRQSERSMLRLQSTPIIPGDVLLMQGSAEQLADFASGHACVPLATRELRIPSRRKAWIAVAAMAAAVAGAATGTLQTTFWFALGALLVVLFKALPLRNLYQSIEWPVIVMLGALIPVAGAMESTGAASLVSQFLMDQVARGDPTIALITIMVLTMFLTDMMNNAATAALMCPIAIGTADALGVNPDAFLMGVAISASCAFLTPVGHQNNTLILGPSGFRFSDYWRVGLPLEIVVLLVAVPALLWRWPL
ncbi:MAG: SLC13 family permease [Xanthomonadales bacterium]|jgi:di/tricarboxylate transporter|nr:SLC13 family permease [Xanthomonadales bacterium]